MCYIRKFRPGNLAVYTSSNLCTREWFTKPVLGHVLGRHVLGHMPGHLLKHVPEYVLKHVPKHVLRHILDKHMLEHVLNRMVHAVLMT